MVKNGGRISPISNNWRIFASYVFRGFIEALVLCKLLYFDSLDVYFDASVLYFMSFQLTCEAFIWRISLLINGMGSLYLSNLIRWIFPMFDIIFQSRWRGDTLNLVEFKNMH